MYYVYTNQVKSEFFVETEYKHLKYQFDFEALAKLTTSDFAKKIENEIVCDNVVKFNFKEGDEHFFLWFYVQNMIHDDVFTIIKAYHNKKDFFTIEQINTGDFEKLGLKISFEDIVE